MDRNPIEKDMKNRNLFEMNEEEQKLVFAQEQAHLQSTYEKLLRMREELEKKLSSVSEMAAAEKREIRENLSLNFEGDSDSMETFIEFEVMNHAIDHFNIERDTSEEKLARVKRLLKAPYFAKIRLQYDPSEEAEEYYIGSAGVSENAVESLVIDWRSPVAETYYNQENGRTFYTVDGRRIDVDLLLRRQFDLAENRLQACFDTQIAIEDPLLIHSLTRQHTGRMQSITATIQKEQNAVIRHENVPVLLVSGIAGSGKTSVLLQRIAWLFYRQRDTLRPDEVVLMTLNPIFRRYIDQVLPDMGEMNPVSMTWKDFLSAAGVRRTGSPQAGGPVKTGGISDSPGSPLSGSYFTRTPFSGTPGTQLESLRQLEKRLPLLRLEPEDLLPVYQKNIQILSRQKIAAVLAQHPNIPAGERLVQITVDELKEISRREIRRRERNEEDLRANAEDDSFPGREDSYEAFEKAYTRSGGSSRAEDNRIQSQYGGAFQAISACQWLNIDRIGCRLLGKKKLSDLERLYLKMLLTGRKDIRTRYVMIDEVQDYTPAQLMVLRKYYPRAKFMLLGDDFQAIREGTADFRQIHEIFETAAAAEAERYVAGAVNAGSAGRSVTELSLMTSYRSSPEITALFAGLLPPERQILVSSVQPPGNEPVFRFCASDREYTQELTLAVRSAQEQGGLTAVLCAGARSMEKTASLLKDKGEDLPLVRSGGSLPGQGIFLITLAHAKGLEFDSVIIPDASADNYPDTLLSRHRLYTAISRATRHLTLLSKGKPTPLLN